MPWKRGRYRGPKPNMTPFRQRRFWAVSISPVVQLDGRFPELRRWFNVERAEKREFAVFYGFNPRCSNKGTWNRPGYFRHFPDHYRSRCGQ